MANNLFVSYDLYNPGQNYEDVIAEIKNLGGWAKIHKSFWYVNSAFSASEAVERVWKKMDNNDTLVIVDATNNSVSWQNLSDEVSNWLRDNWDQ